MPIISGSSIFMFGAAGIVYFCVSKAKEAIKRSIAAQLPPLDQDEIIYTEESPNHGEVAAEAAKKFVCEIQKVSDAVYSVKFSEEEPVDEMHC